MTFAPLSMENFEILGIANTEPGQLVSVNDGEDLIRQQTGFEWLRWNGIPRENSAFADELNKTLMTEKWEIVGVLENENQLLLRRPRYVTFIGRRKK